MRSGVWQVCSSLRIVRFMATTAALFAFATIYRLPPCHVDCALQDLPRHNCGWGNSHGYAMWSRLLPRLRNVPFLSDRALLRRVPPRAPDTREHGDGEHETGIGSSPALGFIIEGASEDAAATMERAIADGHENMQDALLACNTFANSVTPRHRAHDYQKLIRNIHSQIMLAQNVSHLTTRH
ncbi:hypothetical protein C2E23DRAFT_411617 [Lenzites betulinus]|nr:hypothetical protein C2E23DRAFT_411617 [Lenzites betulinus]